MPEESLEQYEGIVAEQLNAEIRQDDERQADYQD